MLTVVIEAGEDAEALARTLASLVHGAVEGVVREVLVHDRNAGADVARIADHAGCRVLRDGELGSGLRSARGNWLLVLEAGARLSEGWTEAVQFHAEGSDRPARFSPSRAAARPLWMRLFRRRPPLSEGLLLTKQQALSEMGAGDLAALAARLRPVRLAAELAPPARRA